METTHKIITGDSRDLSSLPSDSVDIVVTSPPYPMIQMWDELFSSMSTDVKNALEKSDGNLAFDAMHLELDKIWGELYRVLKPGSFACINIGDATRTIGDRFKIYSNHSRIVNSFTQIGFDTLPVILWRKQTNAPNKFMGSGMLPAGAYVTLEHEYILIFRKGTKRAFRSQADKQKRMRSSFFWEERNNWFSDIWDFKGVSQTLKRSDMRDRSAAYPFELAYRLINMYSLYEDIVLDPFLGTGTTTLASLACGRNSVGVEIEDSFSTSVLEQAEAFQAIGQHLTTARTQRHCQFVRDREAQKGPLKYTNAPHGFPVMTRQEKGLELYRLSEVATKGDSTLRASHELMGIASDSSSSAFQVPIQMPATTQQIAMPL